MLYLVVISIVMELILSNITYLNLLWCDEKNQEAQFYSTVQKEMVDIEIETKDIQIQNIKVYYKNPKNQDQVMVYTPMLVMHGLQNEIRTLQPKYTVGNQNVKINLNSENRCLQLAIKIEGLLRADEIEKIVINDTHMEYSFFRNLVIFFVLLGIYGIRKVENKTEWDMTSRIQKRKFYLIIGTIVIGFIIEAFLIIPDIHLCDEEIKFDVNFLNAQIHAILQNQIEITGVQIEEIGDYSMYNEKVYSYFGLAPVVLLMLPFRLLTGTYITNFVTNLIFFIGMIFLFAKLYEKLVKRYVKKVTYFNYVLGFVTLLFSTLIMFFLRGGAHDVVTVCAILFTLLAYLLILSIYENPREKSL